MFFARGEKAIKREGVLANVRMDQQSDFGMQLAKRGEGGERNLHKVADAAYIDEDLIRALIGETSAKLANHREEYSAARQECQR